MANADLVIEILEGLAPKGLCDDHLSMEAHIQPRQQVNQLCRRLADRGVVSRTRGTCARGDVGKLVNTIREAPAAAPEQVAPLPVAPAHRGPSVVEAWRHVDRFCRAIWPRRIKQDPPLALNDLINGLRDQGVVPPHPAIMMHTIRIMRNEVVHMDGPVGPREETIITAAYSIVSEWAQAKEPELWRLTSR